MQLRKSHPISAPGPVKITARSCERPSLDAVTVRPPPLVPGEHQLGTLGTSDESTVSAAPLEPSSGVGVSWDFVRLHSQVSLSLELRALLECLAELHGIHLGERGQRSRGAVGTLCRANALFRRDGAALFVGGQEQRHAQPAAYLAPEARLGAPEVRSDVYSAGVLLFEILAGQELTAVDVEHLSRTDLDAHPLWAQHAADPLLMVAIRATATDPRRRFASASELADAVAGTAGFRVASRQDWADVVQRSIGYQADRLTPVMEACAVSPEGTGSTWARRDSAQGNAPAPASDAGAKRAEATSSEGDESWLELVEEFEELNDEDFIELDERLDVAETEPADLLQEAGVCDDEQLSSERVEDSILRRRRRRRIPWNAMLALIGGAV